KRREVGRRRFGRAKKLRSVFGAAAGAILGALRKFLCGWPTGALYQRAHFLEARVEHLLSRGDPAATGDSPASSKCSAPHDPRGPDVAIAPSLIAQAVS